MNDETYTILFLLLIGAVVCVALHWAIGVIQRRVLRTVALPTNNELISVKKLLLNWMAYALRTGVWLLYVAFVIRLLPQTRAQFESVGFRVIRLRDDTVAWLLQSGISVVITLVVTIFLMRFASALINTGFLLFERSTISIDETAARRRLQTLSAIFRGASQTVIFFIGLMTLLQQLRVNITPILASAGVVGIAVGFGAQSLIKDLFGGFLILLEDQFNVGDAIKIGETNGTVEHLTLRVTRVRGLDGALTTIPNGTITTVSNLSRDWSRVVLDVEVDYAEDVDRAMQVMLVAASQMRTERPTEIIEDPTMLGVDKLSHAAITLRLMAKCSPNKQADIGRELRRRIKLAFDREGIQTPSTTQQLVLKSQPASKTG